MWRTLAARLVPVARAGLLFRRTPATPTTMLRRGLCVPAVVNPLPPPTADMQLGGAVLKDGCASDPVLRRSSLIISRDIKWATMLVGFEQANTYDIKDERGRIVGYIAEDDGLGKSITRNVLSTHRPLTATIFNAQRDPILTLKRPFYVVSSKATIADAQGQQIGEVKMNFHVWQRNYDIYMREKMFAMVRAPVLAWDFEFRDEQQNLLARVNKDWTNLPRELFTDGNQYIVHYESTPSATRHLNLDERAAVLATAFAIDIDYFSHHHGTGVVPPMGMVGMGGGHPAPVPPADVPPATQQPAAGGDGAVDLDEPSEWLPRAGGSSASMQPPPAPPRDEPTSSYPDIPSESIEDEELLGDNPSEVMNDPWDAPSPAPSEGGGILDALSDLFPDP